MMGVSVSIARNQARMLYNEIKSCPICDAKLQENKCSNGCFEYSYYKLIIFGKTISTGSMRCIEIADEHIMFWKENDRYLTEMLK